MDIKTLKALELALIVGGIYWLYRTQVRPYKGRKGETEEQRSGQNRDVEAGRDNR